MEEKTYIPDPPGGENIARFVNPSGTSNPVVPPPFVPNVWTPPIAELNKSEDAKFGKAFLIAQKMIEKMEIKEVEKFISFVNEVKNNL